MDWLSTLAVARSAVGCMQDWVATIANRRPHLADYPLLDMISRMIR